jgi:hypothetical protein
MILCGLEVELARHHHECSLPQAGTFHVSNCEASSRISFHVTEELQRGIIGTEKILVFISLTTLRLQLFALLTKSCSCSDADNQEPKSFKRKSMNIEGDSANSIRPSDLSASLLLHLLHHLLVQALALVHCQPFPLPFEKWYPLATPWKME